MHTLGMGYILSYRIFRNFYCKTLKFSKKENQKNGYRLMNKERQKQTRALFHLFSVLATDFSQTCTFTFIADIYIFVSCARPISSQRSNSISHQKHPRTTCFSSPRGHKLGTPPAKLDHNWLTHIWPIPLFHTPLETPENQKPYGILSGTQNR